ncbi:MAG: alanyl-tRNA editing protein [Candidatus Nanohaloarchaea archaeon]
MTELLYYPDNEYQKEFEAKVQKSHSGKSYITLNQTLFYKEGGGQPADTGKVTWGDKEASVTDVQRKQGEIRHYIDGELPEPDQEIHGEIDWERRYKHMRMHTAQHIVSWIVLNMYDASTSGNQIHEDYSRIDFEPVEFDERDVEKIENGANSLIQKALKVEKKEMERELVEEQMTEGRTNLDLIPDHVNPLRVIEIGGEDICPCGGTHVDNLDEIGEINIIERKSKGANVERLKFELD